MEHLRGGRPPGTQGGRKGDKGRVTFICVNKQTSTEYILKALLAWTRQHPIQQRDKNSEELYEMKDYYRQIWEQEPGSYSREKSGLANASFLRRTAGV